MQVRLLPRSPARTMAPVLVITWVERRFQPGLDLLEHLMDEHVPIYVAFQISALIESVR